MTDSRILDIFYNEIVPEAKKGEIDCYFMFNTAFNLVIDNEVISICDEAACEDLVIPTLKITNKVLFNSLLVEFVRKAIDFYDISNFAFLEDLNKEYKDTLSEGQEEYLIKYTIVANLLANASFEDFDNPINFLKSRIAMLDNKIIESNKLIDIGYIDSIGARLRIIEEKSPIKAETPYRITSYLEFDDGYILHLPEIYAGNTGEKYQLYGIQKTRKNNEAEERTYLKKIRKGFIAKINGAPEHYFFAAMLFISLCSDKEIEVKPFLIERWNAKRKSMFNKVKANQYLQLLVNDCEQLEHSEKLTESLIKYFFEKEEEHDKLQSNITDNLLRYFTKLSDVTIGLDIISFPHEADFSLKLKTEEAIESRSEAFNELFKLISDYKRREDYLGR